MTSVVGTTPTDVPAVTRGRRPWIAAVLSVPLLGLGHLYAGRPQLAVALLVADLAAIPLLAVTMVHAPLGAGSVAVPLAAWLALRVWVARDAARRARVAAVPSHGRAARLLVGLAIVAVGQLAGESVRDAVRARVAESFRFPGGAMIPTILPGDMLFAARVDARDVVRGGLVAYQQDGGRFIHRAVGLPGDTLEVRDRTLYRNGAPVAEPYARYEQPDGGFAMPEMAWQRAHLAPGRDTSTYEPRAGTWGPLVVPEAHVFVLGDNRDHSLDSRVRGFVPRDSVDRRPVRVYWSRDPDTGAVRWGRIGMSLDR